MARLPLTPQQPAGVENRGGSLLVSAAAGSGKTKVLVERLFRYVTQERCNVDDFLIITYPKAAAAELRGKTAAAGLAGGPHDGGRLLHGAAAGEYPPAGPGGGAPRPDAGLQGAR